MNKSLSVPQILAIALGALGLVAIIGAIIGIGNYQTSTQLDSELIAALAEHEVTPFEPLPPAEDELITLGQSLFFDPVLSGNRDISCATCHHPTLASADDLPVSIGTGGRGLGHDRIMGVGRHFIPRHAPELFNRGSDQWRSLFWDGRVMIGPNGAFITPAGDDLPEGLDSVLAAQAMFPVTSPDEMRGVVGNKDILRAPNEMAEFGATDFPLIWDALMVRLLAHSEYEAQFAAAYPDVPAEELGFQHAANAIAAFEMDAFTFTDSPWDLYLAGNTNALTDEQKRGAILFYGSANCAWCHSGTLMTDQEHHNIAVPQYGPGKGDESPLDHGRFRETEVPEDLYAFRTAPLRNVAITAPYMHNGAYATLEAAVRHHLNAQDSFANYNMANLPPAYQQIYLSNPDTQAKIGNAQAQISEIDVFLPPSIELTDQEFSDLMAFLNALTSPSAQDLTHLIPESVPSGLPFD